MKTTYTDLAYHSFDEATKGELDSKEFNLVTITSSGTVELRDADSLAPVIGIMYGKLQNSRDEGVEVNVRLLGKGGTAKVIQDEAIAIGSSVCPTATGSRVRATVAGAADAIGIKIGPSAGAQADVIEILDMVAPVQKVVAAGIHEWAGGAAATDSIPVPGLLATDIVQATLVEAAGAELLNVAANDAANDQIDITLSANGTDTTTKIAWSVIRVA